MSVAADTVVVVHMGFVLFVIFGGFLVLRWRWLALIHLPAAAWGVLIEFFAWNCPLTPLEQRLRLAAGEASYSEGFIEHYILPVLYPVPLTRSMEIVLSTAVLVLNGAIYGLVLYWRLSEKPRTVRR